MGLHHDGFFNDCDPDPHDGKIMAPMVQATYHKYYWTRCSRESMARYIQFVFETLLSIDVNMASILNCYWLFLSDGTFCRSIFNYLDGFIMLCCFIFWKDSTPVWTTNQKILAGRCTLNLLVRTGVWTISVVRNLVLVSNCVEHLGTQIHASTYGAAHTRNHFFVQQREARLCQGQIVDKIW